MLEVDIIVQSIVRGIFIKPQDVREQMAKSMSLRRNVHSGGSARPGDEGDASAHEGIFLPDGSPFPSNLASAAVSPRKRVRG